MKRHFNNCLLIILTLCLSSCVQIDKSILYHKGYNIGVNKNFRLDGFYSDTISRPVFKTKSFSKIKPIFLYSDGSALILETIKDIDALKTLIQLKQHKTITATLTNCLNANLYVAFPLVTIPKVVVNIIENNTPFKSPSKIPCATLALQMFSKSQCMIVLK